VIDRTATSMGGRFLRRALARPLARVGEIEDRQDAVAVLVGDAGLRRTLSRALNATFDLERLCGRLGAGRAGPRDLVSLCRTLAELPEIRDALASRPGRLGDLARSIDPLPTLREELEAALVDEPPLLATEGGVFRDGYSPELDEIRSAATDGKAWIAALQAEERARTGIANLKVGYNRVFGYFLEVTKSNLHAVPEDYHRKQTLVNAERYVTPALKEKESVILGAEERQHDLEAALFEEVRRRVAGELPALLTTAGALAEIDFLRSLADVAVEGDWVRPEVNDGFELHIHDGRHPVVEAGITEGSFIPNDLRLTPERRQILLITGPNMAGKSTYLRQVGILVLLAQVGSFLPARSASIGVADRVFTRVGASDNLARGQSTFLVEMNETANILHNATSRSVVLLDEVGRGTSTFDGLSLAWAITEHLHDGMAGKPRTLFATHFHELTRLAERLRRVANFRVEVKEWEDEVVFLHKIVEGKADRSYGIHVARMAGLPETVVSRAAVILAALEADGAARAETDRVIQTVLPWGATDPVPERNGTPSTPEPTAADPAPSPDRPDPTGPSASSEERAVLDELRAVDPDTLTPLAALTLVSRVKARLDPGR
jgi:DNA mismatch repair protein MutS